MANNSADAINNSSPDSRLKVKTIVEIKGKAGVIQKSVWDDASYSSVITESKDLINGSIIALFMPNTPDEVVNGFHIDDIDTSYFTYHPQIEDSAGVTPAYYDINNDYVIDMFYVTEDGLAYLLRNPDGIDFLIGNKQELVIDIFADQSIANAHDFTYDKLWGEATVNSTTNFDTGGLTFSEWQVTTGQTIYLKIVPGTIYPYARVLQSAESVDDNTQPKYVVISTSLLDELATAIQNSYSVTSNITISDMIDIINGTYTPPENMSGGE